MRDHAHYFLLPRGELENRGLVFDKFHGGTSRRVSENHPRTLRYNKCLVSDAICLPTYAPLENSDGSLNPSTSDSGNCNPAVDLIVALILLLISAILLKYGIWNLYDGPCDWRSVACLVGGWFPFVAGLWILLSLVTHSVTGARSNSIRRMGTADFDLQLLTFLRPFLTLLGDGLAIHAMCWRLHQIPASKCTRGSMGFMVNHLTEAANKRNMREAERRQAEYRGNRGFA